MNMENKILTVEQREKLKSNYKDLAVVAQKMTDEELAYTYSDLVGKAKIIEEEFVNRKYPFVKS